MKRHSLEYVQRHLGGNKEELCIFQKKVLALY